MSSLLAGLKEKFADKLAEFKGSASPTDPADKHAFDLVEAATSDELIAPDWSLNFNVIDFVNNDVRQNTGRTLKALKRSLAKPNTKVQLLALTLLEGCVKNCSVEFHGQLATSELWADVVKLAEDTSITRVDGEVRDKVLGMVEDFSRLQPTQFQAAYESLLDRGVDFPVRAPNESVPLITPPASAASAGMAPASLGAAMTPASAVAGGDEPNAAGVAGAAPAAGAAAEEADPLAGVDEQDRAAIQAALAELEAEAQAAQEAARVAAEADAEERRQQRLLQQQQQQQQQAHLLMQQRQQEQQQRAATEAEEAAALGLLAAAQTAEAAAAAQAATATAAGDSLGVAVQAPHHHQQQPQQQQPHDLADPAVAGAHPQQQQQQPHPHADAAAAEGSEEPVGERVASLLETASNTTLLLSEMLASVPDSEPTAVREPYVAEVADACVRLRRRLERDLATLSDEALLASALSQHEELSRVLLRYDELLAAAESVAPTVPRNAAAVALSHAAASRGAAAAGAGAGVGGGALTHPQGHQHRYQELGEHAHPHGQAPAAGTETAGQKVAAVAAALKERFTGAFDKFMAAATAARAPGAPLFSTGPPATGAATATGPAGSGGATPTSAGAGGAFTLLDDDEEEANEGTALITKRTTQPHALAAVGAAPAAMPQLQPQPQMQQLVHAATAAPPQPQPLPAAAGPDLINFDDDVPPQAADAAAAPPPLSPLQVSQPQHPPAAAAALFIGVEDNQSAATDMQDLLSGLTVHDPAEASGAAAAPPQTPPAAADSEGTVPAPPARAAASSGGGPDQLVEAMDRLVSQSSLDASPRVEAGAGAAQAALEGASSPLAQQEPQPQHP